MVIKNGKRTDIRMHRPKVTMTFSWVVKILWRKRLSIWLVVALCPHFYKTP